ncbi:MAG: hypothetical protein H6667_01180 [Ardenticatenaceae bacterium]|nr:hypothetical protein [Ardenticatenaceae bacterium]
MQRIFTLTRYFLRSFFFSLAGLLYLILALVYWKLFFDPTQGTPDIENYILIIGVFGAAVSFLVALSIAARANQAVHFPIIVRFSSRIEYLTAVLFSTVIAATLLQFLVAALAMFRGPGLVWGRLSEIPPLWLATNILAAALALHASDFVAVGWSRVTLFGILGLLLIGKSADSTISSWLVTRLNGWSMTASTQGWQGLADWMRNAGVWLNGRETGILSQIYSWIIWPFTAISDAVIKGSFTSPQALAPAVLLLYAAILFLLSADLFAEKDLDFVE